MQREPMTDAPSPSQISGGFLPTEDGEFNGNISVPPHEVTLLKRMSDLLDDLSPNETIGFSNGARWIDVATVEEIRKEAYRSTSENLDLQGEIARVVQSVNEWDDRTSPDDYPEHLLITSEELTLILRNFAAAIATSEGSDNG